jgi:hypothetical protein
MGRRMATECFDTISGSWEQWNCLKFWRRPPFDGFVVSRRDARFSLASGLALGLCAALTVSARSSSATDGRGGAAGHPTTVSLTGGAPSLSDSGTTGGTATRRTTATTPSTAGGAPSHLGSSAGTAASSTSTKTVVSPPVGIDAGPTRPTWREPEVFLTVDPSYLAMPHAQQALEGALLAWTSVTDQLPRVTLRYTEDSMVEQSGAEDLADHRIFFAPFGDKRANGALAVTLVTADESKHSILDADILINGGHLFTDVLATGDGKRSTQAYDLQNVIAHELGHWFGLDEDYVNIDATMYAYVYPGETKKRDLTESDITAVQLAYWQADNPSENVGCSLTRPPPVGARWGAGCLAVVLFWLRRRNRRSKPHLLLATRRVHP